MVGVHVGELDLNHELDMLLTLLLLLAQETHEQAFHLITQTGVAIHLQRKETQEPLLYVSERPWQSSCKGGTAIRFVCLGSLREGSESGEELSTWTNGVLAELHSLYMSISHLSPHLSPHTCHFNNYNVLLLFYAPYLYIREYSHA